MEGAARIRDNNSCGSWAAKSVVNALSRETCSWAAGMCVCSNSYADCWRAADSEASTG